MVVIHVENRDLFVALVEECLSGNGRVVEVAIPAHQIAGGVMPRRATQGKGGVCTLCDCLLRRQGDLRGAVGGLPRAGGNRCATVKTVITQLAVQAGRQYPAQGAGRPGVGQQVAVLAELGPARPGTLEEVEVVAAVNALQWCQAKVLRRLNRAQVAVLDPLQHMVGARWHFEAGHQSPVHQFATAVMQVVIVRVDRQHLLFSAGCIGGCSLAAGGF